jgi:O-antigen ligase
MSFSHFINVFRSTSSPSQTFALLIAHVAGRGGMWIAAVGVIAIAWIMTGSRGGTIATIAGIIVLAGLAAIRGRRRAGLSSGILIVSVLIIGVTATTYGDFLADRLNSQGLQSDDRLIVYYLTYQSLFQSPWTGLGWGTFRQAFPMYRGTEIDPRIVYDLAHNTYLELFQGLGIPAALLVLFGILVFVGHCFHGCVTRRHSATAPLVAVAATTLVALHALVDFSLQMQSITLTWVAILATGVSQSWSSRDATQD